MDKDPTCPLSLAKSMIWRVCVWMHKNVIWVENFPTKPPTMTIDRETRSRTKILCTTRELRELEKLSCTKIRVPYI